ncbi:MAG: bifunctional (p)ppGpp synthetase/guanosine-3',5'-bis(diphosphate) 3'-pyrophosphohydrolase [Actinobacteria bacterium]|nr:bifunctional (p)ppGpp synthetase/guanosine-3',5'-bis(diphosphate) 3'-pyrophosphohydrolase [Actinomycetota bacterium]NBY15518.1 bifunctional (p)ppGpp synthetase/guanosine-3',5'-bis(diphosphate) 3'-pyrophosphohydrolase [Actinomycetota bacterium]
MPNSGAVSESLELAVAAYSGENWAPPANLLSVIDSLLAFHPASSTERIYKGYQYAAYFHREQSRRSGDSYITHPVAVAGILADLGMTEPTIIAALLHDTVEDTAYSLVQLEQDFGSEVAGLVDGVTKLDKVKFGNASAAETVRKMVVAMARDIRVLVIKLTDRLHNMRTLSYLPAEKQEQKARETLEIYAPLAHRLGMNAIKWELEDLSFATLYPKMFDEIVRLVDQQAPARDEFLNKLIAEVQVDLKEAGLETEVSGRPKHYYSVYQKMIVRGRDFQDIYDLTGVRILVDSIQDCYATLGVVHNHWNPVPGRFKDYIAMPKFTMYQSLHTTVIGPGGKPVEFQIRTHEMHRAAEYGVASHWRYKQNQVAGKSGPDDLGWVRQLLDWQRETEDPGEFLDSLREDLGVSEVYVFTPKGEVLALPKGSTPIDFAYSVHTEVGNRCVGARINGKLAPLDTALSNGDTVEVITNKSDSAGPSRDWLNIAVSARAKSKIKSWFSKERREEAIESGKDQIARAMKKQGVPLRLLTNSMLASLAADGHYSDVSSLYAAVGEGHLGAQTVVTRLLQAHGGEEGLIEETSELITPGESPTRRASKSEPGVTVIGAADTWVKLARCCTPVPGDEVFGFVTRGSGVSVHRTDCVNAGSLQLQAERIVEVKWTPGKGSVYLVNIQVEALDRSRLLSDVTKALSDQHVNILNASVTTTRDRVAISRFTFEMADPSHLNQVLRAVRGIDGVFDVYRV